MNQLEKQIYEWMSDEQSKDIYKKRVMYKDTFAYTNIQSIVDLYVPECCGTKWIEISEKLEEVLNNYSSVVVVGCGQRGKSLMQMLLARGFCVEAGVDNGFEGEFLEIPICNVKNLKIKDVCFLVSPANSSVAVQMKQQLVELGVDENNVYILNEYTDPGRIVEERQYFDPVIPYETNEVFVDCGAYDLETSYLFTKECEKQSVDHIKIIAFEADDLNYEKCLEKKKLLSKENVDIQVIHKGVWDKDEVLHLSGNNGSESVVSADGNGDAISVCAMDHEISERITFIKMDIEGAELAALHGAERLIKEYRPKLAISIYHKPEDLTELPCYIKSIVPNYKLYMRHYSNHTGETVLYAI